MPKKICPFMSKVMNDRYCDEKDCALYDERSKQCSIVTIRQDLNYLATKSQDDGK
jgi:hypothetical protein